MSLSFACSSDTWSGLVTPDEPNPNSIFSCRFTGRIVTVSMPKGTLKRRPGPTVPIYFPNRWTMPTLSGPTV